MMGDEGVTSPYHSEARALARVRLYGASECTDANPEAGVNSEPGNPLAVKVKYHYFSEQKSTMYQHHSTGMDWATTIITEALGIATSILHVCAFLPVEADQVSGADELSTNLRNSPP